MPPKKKAAAGVGAKAAAKVVEVCLCKTFPLFLSLLSFSFS
jgi:hypothetical protein